MKAREVIFREEAAIAKEKAAYVKYIDLINKAIRKIEETGVEFTDLMLSALWSNKEHVVREAVKQVKAEQKSASKFKFLAQQVDTTPLEDELHSILDALHRGLFSPYTEFNPEYVSFVDGRAALIDDFDSIVEEKHSISLGSENKAKAWALAKKAKEALDELEAFLQEHGDGKIHACATAQGHLYDCSAVLLNPRVWADGFSATLYPHIIPHIID